MASSRFTLATALFKLTVDRAELTKGLKDAEGDAERGGSAIARALQKTISPKLLFGALLTSVGALFGQLANIGVTQLRTLDAAQKRFRAETGASAKEAQQFSSIVRTAYTKNILSVDTLADAAVALRREMGLTTDQVGAHIQDFLDFAKVTGQDAPTAIKALDDIMDAWGLTIRDSTVLMDRLKKTSELTGASVVGMEDILVTGSGVFQALGLSIDDVIALLGKMAQTGVRPETTMRALASAAEKIHTPAQFRKLIDDIAAIEDPTTRATAAFELFGTKGGSELAKLLGRGGFALDALKAKIADSEGTVRRASGFWDSFNDKIEFFKRGITNLATTFAGPLFGALSSAALPLLALQNLFPGIGAAIGLVSKGLLLGFIGAIKAAVVAIVGFISALNPIVLVIAAVVAIVGFFAAAWTRNWFHIRDVVKEIAPGVAAVIDGIVGKVQAAIDFLGRLVGRARKALTEVPTVEGAPGAGGGTAGTAGGEAGPLGVQPAAGKPSAADQARLKAFQDLLKTIKGGAGTKAINEVLEKALKQFDDLVALDRLSTEQQIANLQRIGALYAKTADERVAIAIRVQRLEIQLANEQAEKSKQSVEDSLQFIQERLVPSGASFAEIAAAYQRVIDRLKGMTDAAFGSAAGRAEALRRVMIAFSNATFQATLEANEKTIALRADLQAEMEKLTLDETEVERREINRRFDALRRDALARTALAKDGAAALVEIERNRQLALAALDKREVQARLEQAVELADAEAALGGEDRRVEARQALLRVLTEGSLAYKRVLLDIKGIEDDRTRGLREQAEKFLDFVRVQRQLGKATIEDEIAALQAVRAHTTALEELARIDLEILTLQQQLGSADPFKGLRLAIQDALKVAFDWRDAWKQAIDEVKGGLASAFKDFITGQKTVWESLLGIATSVLDAILDKITKFVADKIVNDFLGILSAGAGGGGGGGILEWLSKLFSFARGGILRGGVLAMQHGGVFGRPALAALAEAPGMTELVQPLPRGMRPADLAQLVRRGAEGGGGPVTVNNYNVVRNDSDIARIGRATADALRMAQRGNHPFFRGGR